MTNRSLWLWVGAACFLTSCAAGPVKLVDAKGHVIEKTDGVRIVMTVSKDQFDSKKMLDVPARSAAMTYHSFILRGCPDCEDCPPPRPKEPATTTVPATSSRPGLDNACTIPPQNAEMKRIVVPQITITLIMSERCLKCLSDQTCPPQQCLSPAFDLWPPPPGK